MMMMMTIRRAVKKVTVMIGVDDDDADDDNADVDGDDAGKTQLLTITLKMTTMTKAMASHCAIVPYHT